MAGLETFLFFIAGLILLYLGGESLIRGSSNFAIKAGITPLVVGLTVVAFGTSAPELVVSLKAALIGNSSISLGNVIGSNIANIALIVGLAALVRPIKVHSKVIITEIPIMIAVSILLILLLLDGKLVLIEGILFVVILVIYVTVNVYLSKKEVSDNANAEYETVYKKKFGMLFSIFLIAAGLLLLVYGANLLVMSAISIAKYFKISDAVIGLTIVAVGTSLPELVTSVVASYKRESDIAVGNVVGSNIFNILAILGITVLFVPISSEGISYFDFSVMFVTSLALLFVAKWGSSITRFEGFLFLIGYAIYVYFLLP